MVRATPNTAWLSFDLLLLTGPLTAPKSLNNQRHGTCSKVSVTPRRSCATHVPAAWAGGGRWMDDTLALEFKSFKNRAVLEGLAVLLVAQIGNGELHHA
jgi:hypothetical protein